MPTVKFTANLKRFYPELAPQQIEVGTVAEVLHKIDLQFPGIRDYIVDERGHLRKHVNIFIGNQIIGDKEQLSDHVDDNDEVYIMQALSGG